MSSASDYSELSQREAVLKRPEMYMGNTAVVRHERPDWVATGFPPDPISVEQRAMTASDALIRIWIEPFSNAVDSVFRSNSGADKKVDKQADKNGDKKPVCKARATFISVIFDESTQRFSVENDGWGIPLEMHASAKPAVMVPTMIFSRFSTSSNYDDEKERITSGLNGLGSKLTNTMSSQFAVELRTCSLQLRKHPWQLFRQHWQKNMSLVGEPEFVDEDKPDSIVPGYGTVKVSWVPDWSRFGAVTGTSMSLKRADARYLPDELAYIQRLVLDAAMQMSRYGVRVLWNHHPVQVGTLLEYARIFVPLPEDEKGLDQHEKDETAQQEEEEEESVAEATPSESQSETDEPDDDVAPTTTLPLHKQVLQAASNNCEIVILPMVSTQKLLRPRDQLSISFVNGIYTAEGGIHVAQWEKSILKPLLLKLKLKLDVRDVRRYFAVFVNAFRLNQPKFSTQSKTKLIDSGEAIDVKINRGTIEQMRKWSVVDMIRAEDMARNRGLLDKLTVGSANRLGDIEDFDDAYLARNPSMRHLTTLVGTEGKSARAFVMNALNAPPPAHLLCPPTKDYVGIKTFRGKGLNVTNASIEKLSKNKEVQALIKILNLKTTVDYRNPADRATVRYGKFLMIGDADLDGFHIVSLLYNFFATLYPTLLQNTQQPFFFFLRTPIITLRSTGKELHLYSWLHAHAYLDQLYEDRTVQSKYKVVYRKGLGVWNEREPKVEAGRHPVHLYWLEPGTLPVFGGGQQPEKRVEEVKTEEIADTRTPEEVQEDLTQQMVAATEYMNHVFHKDHAAFRRKWLDEYVKTRRALSRTVVSEVDPSVTTADYEVSQQSVREFFSQELILFNEASCGRNLPRRDDGLKLSQRKIVYSAMMKPLPYGMQDPLKVSQFCGYVAEQTQYHYGDQALNDAIVRLAQSYVGSNNIPLLFPEGNFGSRDDNGNDAAASRYIHTKLNCIVAGTQVELAQGISVPIQDVAVGDMVLGLSDDSTQLVPRVVKQVLDQGDRPCVELLFSDGRILSCTSDHRILTADGTWVTAGDLELGVSRVSLGPTYPMASATDVRDTDSQWTVDLTPHLGLTLSVATDADRRRAHAFARLAGHVLTDGYIGAHSYPGSVRGVLRLEHQIDVDVVCRDLTTLGLRAGRWTFERSEHCQPLPTALCRALIAVGIATGKRQDRIVRLPSTFTCMQCPTDVLREFLGSMFGGDGGAPHFCHTIGRFVPPFFCANRLGTVAQAQLADWKSSFVPLLARFGISADQITLALRWGGLDTRSVEGRADLAAMETAGLQISQTMVADSVLEHDLSYTLFLSILKAGALPFLDKIGYRYCAHKQQRGAAAASWLRLEARVVEDRELVIQAASPQFRPGQRGGLQIAVATAKANLAETRTLHPATTAWAPPSLHLYERRARAPLTPRQSLAAFDTERFFSIIREPNWADKMTGAVRPGVQPTASGLPMYSVVLVARRGIGVHATFDLVVNTPAGVEPSFTANGVVVHNCMTRLLFREEDDDYLVNDWDDGHKVEKREYCPILPMLLVNGASGVATGWSTRIPPHNPVVLANWIRVWLAEKARASGFDELKTLEYPVIHPWWRGFKGTVVPTPVPSKYAIWGAIGRLPAPNVLSKTHTVVQINELPIGISMQKYRKDVMNTLREKGDIEFMDHGDSGRVDFKVLFKSARVVLDTMTDEQVMLLLKLRTWSTQQLVCLTSHPTEIVKYDRVEDILLPYCERRLELFETVRQGQITRIQDQVDVETNKRRFVQSVVDKVIVLNEYDDDGLENVLKGLSFRVDPDKGKGYHYLTDMPVRSLTRTRVQMLEQKIAKLNDRLVQLQSVSATAIWTACLDEWEKVWAKWLADEESANVMSRSGAPGKKVVMGKRKVGKK